MLIECQNCGAPLDIKLASRIVKCNYCGKSNRVASTRTVAEHTPRGWQAPPVWTPPPQFPAPSVPIQYHRRSSAPLVLGAVMALLILGVSAGAVFWSTSSQSSVRFDTSGINVTATPMSPATPPLSKGQAWDGRSTLSCGMGETLEIIGKQADVDGTVIDASMSCTVRIKNCTLKGRTVIAAAIGAKVEIENSTLEAQNVIIDGAQTVRVSIEKSSRLSSEDTGLRMGQASRVTIRDSTIDAKAWAIEMGMAAHLDADKARIVGKSGSIDAASSSEITLDDSVLVGKRKLASNVRVREK